MPDVDGPSVWIVPSRPDHYHPDRSCHNLQKASWVIPVPASEAEDRDLCRACVGVSETRPRAAETTEIVAAIEAAIRTGDTALNGEPGYDHIVERVPLSRSTLKDRVQMLVDEGTLTRSASTRLRSGGEIATFTLAPDADTGELEVPADD